MIGWQIMKNAIKYVYDVNPFYVHWKGIFALNAGTSWNYVTQAE